MTSSSATTVTQSRNCSTSLYSTLSSHCCSFFETKKSILVVIVWNSVPNCQKGMPQKKTKSASWCSWELLSQHGGTLEGHHCPHSIVCPEVMKCEGLLPLFWPHGILPVTNSSDHFSASLKDSILCTRGTPLGKKNLSDFFIHANFLFKLACWQASVYCISEAAQSLAKLKLLSPLLELSQSKKVSHEVQKQVFFSCQNLFSNDLFLYWVAALQTRLTFCS